MIVKVLLPDLYRAATGVYKKRLAWSYLKRYDPAYEPLPDQPELESHNVLICRINFEKQKEITKKLEERMNTRKK